MREIIFRGYSKQIERWVYGYLMYNNIIIDKCGKEWRVEAESVGQYTGYCDKNSWKVFEGDILTWDGNFYRIKDLRGLLNFDIKKMTIAAHSYKVE